jgi:1-acyl-sn-glycerol-3-phosphate acyltransferase
MSPDARYSPRILALFARYVRGYVRRAFTAVRIARDGAPPSITGPTVFFANHAAWWDPLVLLVVGSVCYPRERLFAPIDAGALRRYPFLARCGMFGIHPDSPRGAREFLAAGRELLDRGAGVLAVTAQGRFADVRERPLVLKRGVAKLLHDVPRARAIPVAVEYPFWNERRPESLVRFGGDSITADGRGVDAIHADLRDALERTLDELALDAQSRDPTRFETLLSGPTGAGLLEDLPQRIAARLKGRRFDPAHGAIERHQ